MSYVDHHSNEVIGENGRLPLVTSLDRRRPGRMPVNPELLTLLRGDMPVEYYDDEETSPPLVGIAVAVALSVPLWMVIGLVIWLLH